MSGAQYETVTTIYGLQHPNGYIRDCQSKQEAIDLKSGKVLHGRRGDWKNHEIVQRTRTVIVSAWEPAEIETEAAK